MRISIREALFGGEEIDDWEPPRPEWIPLRDTSETYWSDEVCSIKNTNNKDGINFKLVVLYNGYSTWVISEGEQKLVAPSHKANVSLSSLSTGWRFWYLPEADLTLRYDTSIGLTSKMIEAAKEEVAKDPTPRRFEVKL